MPDKQKTASTKPSQRPSSPALLTTRHYISVVLPGQDAAALVPRDAIVGRGEALLGSPVGPLGVVVSYEVFFADRVREAVIAGGQVVLVPTSAASFVTGEVPAMEVAAARCGRGNSAAPSCRRPPPATPSSCFPTARSPRRAHWVQPLFFAKKSPYAPA